MSASDAHDPAHADETWVGRHQRVDLPAFERIWSDGLRQRWLMLIAATLPAWLRARVDAEDVLQEALARAWKGLATAQPVDEEGAEKWATAIIRNTVVDVIRRHRSERRDARREAEAPTESRGGGNVDSETPSRCVARQQHVALALEALDEMPEKQRLVILNRVLAGLSAAETAEELGMSPRMVHVNLHRALAEFGRRCRRRGLRTSVVLGR